MAISLTLAQGNQALFDKCQHELAKKYYNGDVIKCFREIRNSSGLGQFDQDSLIDVDGKSLSWSFADGDTNKKVQFTDKKIAFAIAIVGFIVFIQFIK